jgi:hypothetical protein
MDQHTERLIERIEDIYDACSNMEFKSIYIDIDGKEYEADLILHIAGDINESWIDDYEIEGVWNAYGSEVDLSPEMETAIQTKVDEIEYTPTYEPKESDLNLDDLKLD